MAKLRNGADDERQQYAARGGRIIWRLLMPRTRNHVYYRLNEAAGDVEILACGTRSLAQRQTCDPPAS